MGRGLDRRGVLAAGAALALAAPGARAQTQAPRVRLMLDWAFQAPNAFALVAREKGYFREAGVEVQVDPGRGSGAVPVALAGGSHDLGFADLSTVMKFAAENPAAGILVVAVLLDRAPLCAIVRADGPVRVPRDLEGRKLAAPDFDGGRQLFPAFARAAGLDASKVEWVTVAPALREPMLVQRRADGVTGFVTTSALALKGLGLDLPQQRVMMYYDHGLDLHGGALITTRAFADANPDAVRRAVAGLFRGFRAQLADPADAMALLKRVEPLTDVALELERHRLNAERCILTDRVRAEGLSSVDPARFAAGLRAVEEAYGLPARPGGADLYDPRFLPPRAERAV